METLFDESANRNNPSFLFCPGDKRPSRDQHLPPRWFVDRRGGIFFHVETSDDVDPSKTWGESVVRLANHFLKIRYVYTRCSKIFNLTITLTFL